MPYVVVSEPGRVAFPLALAGPLRVGRGSDNELVISDRQASRQHATLVPAGDGWEVVDEGSRHGTLINGAAAPRVRLADGDVIQVGGTTLTFRTAEPPTEIVHAMPTAHEAPAAGGGRDRVFGELAAAVGRLDDSEAMAAALLGAVVAATGAERGVLALAAPGGRPRVLAELGRGLAVAPAHASAIVDGGQAVIARSGDGRLALGAPLRHGEQILGLIYVDDRAARADRFGSTDLELVARLGRLAGMALAAAERVQRADALAALAPPSTVGALLGVSPAMAALRDDVERYGRAGVAVVISGETGCGKELVARALHAASPRAAGPLVAINCGALPPTLLETELFGHVRGAFTGAGADRRGRLALAHGGTLFLDEVADLSPQGQAALLRVLEDGEVVPVGSERALRVDVRVIAASHKPLAAELRAGRFREDLYYRLAAVELVVPPLRARGDDVYVLAEHFRAAAAARHHRDVTGFTADAAARLAAYPWPGNVRELRHEVERAVLVAAGPLVDAAELGPRLRDVAAAAAAPAVTLAARFAALDGTERALIGEALQASRGNVAAAARLLGITRIMLKRRLDRMEIARGDEPEER